jgi:hypothetical protein
MNLQGAQEGGDRRKQPLLQSDKSELRVCRVPRREASNPLGPELAIGGEHLRQPKFGGGPLQAVEHNRLDGALRKRARINPPQICLEPAHYDGFLIAGPDRHPAREALPVEHFEQRRKAVRMAVMRGCGQEEAMFEPVGQPADGLGELAVDRIARAARRCGVMRLVENQQRTRSECPRRPRNPAT